MWLLPPPRRVCGHHLSCRAPLALSSCPMFLPVFWKGPRHFPGFSSLSTIKLSYPFCLLSTHLLRLSATLLPPWAGPPPISPKGLPSMFLDGRSDFPLAPYESIPHPTAGEIFYKTKLRYSLLKILQWLPITLRFLTKDPKALYGFVSPKSFTLVLPSQSLRVLDTMFLLFGTLSIPPLPTGPWPNSFLHIFLGHNVTSFTLGRILRYPLYPQHTQISKMKSCKHAPHGLPFLCNLPQSCNQLVV